jgi:hypothetical protein
MNTITINGKTADITLENETTLGEVLSGFDSWLSGSNLYLSGVEIDGKTYGSSALEEAFTLSLDGISRIDIKAASRDELMLEALAGIQNDLAYLAESPREAGQSVSAWETSSAAVFLAEHDADMYGLVARVLEGKTPPRTALLSITERIRELRDPAGELRSAVPLITEAAGRLEDFALDTQTGKDRRAAETLALFSGITEKLLRLFGILKNRGADTAAAAEFLNDFCAMVKELYTAYENKDTVLVGDLAEYELAPKLLEFSSLLTGIAVDGITVDGGPP